MYESRCDLAGFAPILVNEEIDVDTLYEATSALANSPFEPLAFVVWALHASKKRQEPVGGVIIGNSRAMIAGNSGDFSGGQ